MSTTRKLPEPTVRSVVKPRAKKYAFNIRAIWELLASNHSLARRRRRNYASSCHREFGLRVSDGFAADFAVGRICFHLYLVFIFEDNLTIPVSRLSPMRPGVLSKKVLQVL